MPTAPVAPTTAFRLGEKTADPLQMYLSDIFTIPVNLAGTCAMSRPCGVAGGLAGGIFSQLLVLSSRGLPGRLGAFARERPVAFGAACGLLLAVIGLASGGTTYGTGYHEARKIVESTEALPATYGMFKWLASLVSYISGIPGGLFSPSLAVGAGLGAKLAWLDGTPVNDFLLPGLFILGIYGLATLFLMVGLVWRASPGFLRRLDLRLGRHWSWAGTMLVGAVLVAWILYEFAIFPDRMVLQPILIGVGALMVAIPLLPSMRGFFATST